MLRKHTKIKKGDIFRVFEPVLRLVSSEVYGD